MILDRLAGYPLLVRAFRFPFTLLPQEHALPILSGALRGKRWILASTNYVSWFGIHEQEKQRLFQEKIHVGQVVYDIGAHVGFYTLLASRLVGPTGRVVAFEPLPRNLHYLRRHVLLNRATNVQVVEAAVGDRIGEVSFDEGPNTSMGRVSTAGMLRVRMVTVDALVSTGQLPPPHHLKIDVEGADMLVLAGARSTLEAYRPSLFIDIHGAHLLGEAREFLTQLGYDIQPIGGGELDHADELFAAARRAAPGNPLG